MKKIKKRILSATIAAIIATSGISTVTYAEKVSVVGYQPYIYHNPNEEFTQGNFIFAPIEGEDNVYIVGLVDRTVTEVTIPSSVNGKRVTIIDAMAFSRCPNLTSVYVPDGVLWIAEAAFAGCDKLKSVRLPDSITIIDMFAFSDSPSLQEITLPEHLGVLGFKVFYNSKNLKNIYYPKSKPELDEASLYGLEKAGLKEGDAYWKIFDGTIEYYNGKDLSETKAIIHYNTSSPSQTVNPGTGSNTPNTPNITDPRLALALDKAKYALSSAQDVLNKANVALENARKKKSFVFDGNDFVQVADTNAVKEAELDVQRAELIYREAELNYQQIQALINNSTQSVYGDTNGDNKFGLSDVSYLIKQYMNDALYSPRYDLNNDGVFGLKDVSIIIQKYMNS